MPSTTPKQKQFMAAVANNPSFAKKVGVPQAVGKDFARADKAKGFSTQAEINRPNTAHGKMDMPFHSVTKKAKGGEMKESKAMMGKEISFMKKKGAPKSMLKHEMAEMKSEGRGMAKADMQKKAMKSGGIASSLKAHAAAPASKAHAKMARGGGIESRGKTKGTIIKMARGGGVEVRGKTKGRMI
jgi:hypothetical protein